MSGIQEETKSVSAPDAKAPSLTGPEKTKKSRKMKDRKEQSRRYYLKHREEILKRNKARREKDRDKYLEYKKNEYIKRKVKHSAYSKKYRESHKLEIAEKRKEYEIKNKEKLYLRYKKYRQSHPEKSKIYSRRYYEKHPDLYRDAAKRRRTLINGIKTEKIISIEIYNRDGWICGLCHKKVDKNLKYPDPMSASLDHIVPIFFGGTHTYDNVQCSHLSCNRKAHTGGVKQLLLPLKNKEDDVDA